MTPAPRRGARDRRGGLKFFEIPADEFHAAAAELSDVGHGLTAITHPRQSARTFQALLRAALFCFQPNLSVPFCFPLADRAELLFGDQEGHHVFPVVRFSFQPLTVHLSLGITHLAAHIVFGLNRGHSGEPTTAWPIGANTSATFVHHEYSVPAQSTPGNGQSPRFPMPTFHVLCPARAERADRRPNRCAVAGAPVPMSPVAGPHRRPRRREPGVRHHRSQILMPPPVLYSQIPFPTEYPDGFTTFTQTSPPHRAHTPP
jgi:hypothetical protein